MRKAIVGFALLAALWLPGVARADFGIYDFDVTFTGPGGEAVSQAGAHPFAMTTSFRVNGEETPEGGVLVDEPIKDLLVTQIAGFAGAPTAVPTCSTVDFLTDTVNLAGEPVPNCPDSTAVGTVAVLLSGNGGKLDAYASVYNIEPSPGVPTKFGFNVGGTPVTVEAKLSEEHPYSIVAGPTNTSQLVETTAAEFTLWGVPADPAHDSVRGRCFTLFGKSVGKCPVSVAEEPFLTLPRSCRGPQAFLYEADSWHHPGAWLADGTPDLSDPNWVTGSVLSHDEFGAPQGMTRCSKLAFNPGITAKPTSKAATSPTGLDFSLDIEDEGLTNPTGIAGADIEKTVVTLPEGMSVNPSQAEGLEVCTEAQVEKESSQSGPGEGCPQASKIGSLELETPLLEGKLLKGSLYVAKPYENPFGSLLALYIVIKDRGLGISVVQPAEVIPDPKTGRLTTIAEDLPELPFSHFRLHFREGARSPLATPPACGSYDVKAVLYPSSAGSPVTSTSSFQIVTGPDGGPCPSGGLPPFRPGLVAGTLNNRAGGFSPFNLRLHRSDSEQEFTRFSIKLPPGIAGILAGIPKCPDAAIEAAKQRTGTEELANPSCPVASEVGSSLAGAGVGPALAYAPGKIYLAGPYEGAPISIAAITAAKVGPFDVGTVVIRQGFKIDPRTAEVFLDPVGSDPIPHIIDGIPVHARDIRAYVDRPNFVFNPTSCERTATTSTLLGSGLDFASASDDNPVVVSSPFQAADCAALGFRPKLDLRLIGGTKRGAHPRFRAFLRMDRTEANVARARVTLPRSTFLDQGHIRTVCTRVQFKERQCPQASIYGYAKAVTPVLDAPIEGPVYLRSSENKLPDLVAALRSQEGIEIELVGRIDSVKGRIRNTFDVVPDAPVDSFVLTMQGGAKGLIVNSTDLCKGKHRAIAEFDAHNGRARDWRPVVRAKCPKSRKRH
ncbi:MAG TPA: hypothetical protein VNO20_07565 [Solirubrobacterales bacterium]|nr:hypothetical protein [Solirubrobacterales bacterium]